MCLVAYAHRTMLQIVQRESVIGAGPSPFFYDRVVYCAGIGIDRQASLDIHDLEPVPLFHLDFNCSD